MICALIYTRPNRLVTKDKDDAEPKRETGNNGEMEPSWTTYRKYESGEWEVKGVSGSTTIRVQSGPVSDFTVRSLHFRVDYSG